MNLKRISVAAYHAAIAVFFSVLFTIGLFINQYLVEQNISLPKRGEGVLYNPHTVLDGEIFVFSLLLILTMIGIAGFIMSNKGIRRFREVSIAAYFGYLFYLGVTLILFDITFGSWAPACGSTWERGNCFMLDGIVEGLYIVLVPACVIVGTILIVAGKKRVESKV